MLFCKESLELGRDTAVRGIIGKPEGNGDVDGEEGDPFFGREESDAFLRMKTTTAGTMIAIAITIVTAMPMRRYNRSLRVNGEPRNFHPLDKASLIDGLGA